MVEIRWDPEPWASLGRWLAPSPGQHQPPDPDLALADLDQLLDVVRVTFDGLSMPLAAPERFAAETPASADLIQLWANLVGPAWLWWSASTCGRLGPTPIRRHGSTMRCSRPFDRSGSWIAANRGTPRALRNVQDNWGESCS